jgi:hypothetical protein
MLARVLGERCLACHFVATFSYNLHDSACCERRLVRRENERSCRRRRRRRVGDSSSAGRRLNDDSDRPSPTTQSHQINTSDLAVGRPHDAI